MGDFFQITIMPPPHLTEANADPSQAEDVTSSYLYNEWAIGTIGDSLPIKDVEELQRVWEERAMEDSTKLYSSKLFEVKDCIPLIREAAQTMVNDNFTQCFESVWPEPWNWNVYLFPMWVIGVFVRYCILFPLRLLCLLFGTIIVFTGFAIVSNFIRDDESKHRKQRTLIKLWAQVFVTSWSGVVKYHGIRPRRGADQIHVANHTSMIDVIVLQQQFPYAIVGQQHKGGVGFIQNRILKCMGCLWFERSDIKDRQAVGKKIKEHIQNPDHNPLLIFPEGTCVNNRYCVMFKKGAFDLGAKVYPIAIRYNKEYCNPFWNSRKESFWKHLFNLMTSWAVVCDVYYLDPQTIQPDETPVQFANRIKEMIAAKAELVCVPWDGYLKHLRPSSKFVEHRQKLVAQSMLRRIHQLEDGVENGINTEKENHPESNSKLKHIDNGIPRNRKKKTTTGAVR